MPGVSPHNVTSIAMPTSGLTRAAAGPAPRMPSSSCTAATPTTVAAGESPSRRIASIMTAQPARSSTALPENTFVPFRARPVRANVARSPTRTPRASVSARLVVPTSTWS